MPKRVNIPGVGIVNFPDSLSGEELTAAVQKIANEKPLTLESAGGTPAADRMAADDAKVGNTFLGNVARDIPTQAGNALSGLLDMGKSVANATSRTSAPGMARLGLGLMRGEDPETMLRATAPFAPTNLEKVAIGVANNPTGAAQGIGHAIKGAVTDPRGTARDLGNYAYEHPIGAAMDASILLTGGGSLASRLPGMAGRAGEMAALGGRALDPGLRAAQMLEVGASVATPMLRQGAERLMNHALGMHPMASPVDRLAGAAALDIGATPSRGGLETTRAALAPLHAEGERLRQTVQGPVFPRETPEFDQFVNTAQRNSPAAPVGARQAGRVRDAYEQGLADIDQVHDRFGSTTFGRLADLNEAGNVERRRYLTTPGGAAENYGEIGARDRLLADQRAELYGASPEWQALQQERAPLMALQHALQENIVGPNAAVSAPRRFSDIPGAVFRNTVGSPYLQGVAAHGMDRAGQGLARGSMFGVENSAALGSIPSAEEQALSEILAPDINTGEDWWSPRPGPKQPLHSSNR